MQKYHFSARKGVWGTKIKILEGSCNTFVIYRYSTLRIYVDWLLLTEVLHMKKYERQTQTECKGVKVEKMQRECLPAERLWRRTSHSRVLASAANVVDACLLDRR